jgi:hypothetical protein
MFILLWSTDDAINEIFVLKIGDNRTFPPSYPRTAGKAMRRAMDNPFPAPAI